MSDERILTVPAVAVAGAPVVATANEYVALPEIRQADAACLSLNVLHKAARGLIEWVGADGEPLLTPHVALNGASVDLTTVTVPALVDDCLPTLTGAAGALEIDVRWYAPPGYRGCVLVWRLRNLGKAPVQIAAGLDGSLGVAHATVFHRRPLAGERRLFAYEWTDSLVAEAVAGVPALALAFKAVPACEVAFEPLAVPNDSAWGLRFRLRHHITLLPGEGRSLTYFIGVGTEADGAALAAVDLARRGHLTLWDETRARQAALRRTLADERLSALLNKNLLFNYWFTRGRTLDTEEEVLVTSRSPRYYVSAAFWARDALLWSLPALLICDPAAARSALVTAWRQYLRNAGSHACYIDGAVLYPGFELDELAAYLVGLGTYLQATGDFSLLRDVAPGLAEWEALLWRQRHPSRMLFRTFLLPSDDPAQLPYVTYDNVLVWRALRVLSLVYTHLGRAADAERVADAAERLRAELLSVAVAEGPAGAMFVWACDPDAPAHVLYDEPSGSLGLLALYGFVPPDDAVFANTCAWINSSHNPYFEAEGAYRGPACPHAPQAAWVLAIANDLAAGRDVGRWLRLLARAPLDNGYACESVDVESGVLRTGAAMASGAGWLAAAVWAAAASPRCYP